jgi:hypothetical protein
MQLLESWLAAFPVEILEPIKLQAHFLATCQDALLVGTPDKQFAAVEPTGSPSQPP